MYKESNKHTKKKKDIWKYLAYHRPLIAMSLLRLMPLPLIVQTMIASVSDVTFIDWIFSNFICGVFSRSFATVMYGQYKLDWAEYNQGFYSFLPMFVICFLFVFFFVGNKKKIQVDFVCHAFFWMRDIA